MNSGVRVWIGAAFGFIFLYAGFLVWRAMNQAPLSGIGPGVPDPVGAYAPAPPESLAELRFVERNGQPFEFQTLSGQVWIGSFFFASCPSTCVQMNRAVSTLQPLMKERGVKLVSITVDPDQDSPQRLRQYAASFNADPEAWLFLTGPFVDAQFVAARVLKIAIQKFAHTEQLVLVDRQGQAIRTYQALKPEQLELLKQDVEQVLAGEPVTPSTAASATPAEQHSANSPAPLTTPPADGSAP